MPYISKERRKFFDKHINEIVDNLYENRNEVNNTSFNSGDLNYVISKVVWKLFNKNKKYNTANGLVGVLECVKQEFYRRQVVPYEDGKIKSEGDI
jgi:hypothetical protein